jgi:hypothetical protein
LTVFDRLINSSHEQPAFSKSKNFCYQHIYTGKTSGTEDCINEFKVTIPDEQRPFYHAWKLARFYKSLQSMLKVYDAGKERELLT